MTSLGTTERESCLDKSQMTWSSRRYSIQTRGNAEQDHWLTSLGGFLCQSVGCTVSLNWFSCSLPESDPAQSALISRGNIIKLPDVTAVLDSWLYLNYILPHSSWTQCSLSCRFRFSRSVVPPPIQVSFCEGASRSACLDTGWFIVIFAKMVFLQRWHFCKMVYFYQIRRRNNCSCLHSYY